MNSRVTQQKITTIVITTAYCAILGIPVALCAYKAIMHGAPSPFGGLAMRVGIFLGVINGALLGLLFQEKRYVIPYLTIMIIPCMIATYLTGLSGGILFAIGAAELTFLAGGVVGKLYLPEWFEEGKCRKCGYDLTGNVSGTCPECGTRVDTAEKCNSEHTDKK